MRWSVIAFLLILAGCTSAKDEHGRPTRRAILPNKIEISKPSSPAQRFLPTNTGDLAFDTKEGLLCKTWYWDADTPQARGSNDGQPHFEAPVCSSDYQRDQENERWAESNKLKLQEEIWKHEETMKGVK